MKQVNNEIILDKEEFLMNCLFMGCAVKALSIASGRDVNTWIKIFTESANAQLDAMTIEQRQAMINAYLEKSNDEKK